MQTRFSITNRFYLEFEPDNTIKKRATKQQTDRIEKEEKPFCGSSRPIKLFVMHNPKNTIWTEKQGKKRVYNHLEYSKCMLNMHVTMIIHFFFPFNSPVESIMNSNRFCDPAHLSTHRSIFNYWFHQILLQNSDAITTTNRNCIKHYQHLSHVCGLFPSSDYRWDTF